MPATKSPGIIAVECQVETLVRNGKNMKNHALFGDRAGEPGKSTVQEYTSKPIFVTIFPLVTVVVPISYRCVAQIQLNQVIFICLATCRHTQRIKF